MTDFDIRKQANAAQPLLETPTNSVINSPTDKTNRGYDNKFTSDDGPPITVTLANINHIILSYLENRIAPRIFSDGVNQVVPVLYGTPERWVTVRRDGAVRDPKTQQLQVPLIMLRRVREERGHLKNPNNEHMYETVQAGWNIRNVYDRYALQNHLTPSKILRTVLVPDYMDLTYEVIIWTAMQVHMDQIIEQINFSAEQYWGDRNNYKFRVMIEDYSGVSQLPTTEDRMIRSEFQMKIGAYLLPAQAVKNFKYQSTNVRSYTPKQIIFQENYVNQIPNATVINKQTGFVEGEDGPS